MVNLDIFALILVPLVGFNPTTYTAMESMAGQLEICVELLSPGTIPQPVSVQISTADGTATGIVSKCIELKA